MTEPSTVERRGRRGGGRDARRTRAHRVIRAPLPPLSHAKLRLLIFLAMKHLKSLKIMPRPFLRKLVLIFVMIPKH